MLSKKNYKAIAEIIRNNTVEPCSVVFRVLDANGVIAYLCDYFAADNPRFDRQRFIDACNEEN